MTESGYMTTEQAAAYLNVSVGTLREWIRVKRLPCLKPGKLLLFRTKDIDLWMQRYRKGDRGLALTGFVERGGR